MRTPEWSGITTFVQLPYRGFMAISANQLQPQVAAAIRALEKLPAKEREVKPSPAFVDNYNTLLELAKEAMPDVDPRRWPPVVGVHKPAMGSSSSEARFTEVHSFLEQIHAILGEGITFGF
jgi:hypothetical protein